VAFSPVDAAREIDALSLRVVRRIRENLSSCKPNSLGASLKRHLKEGIPDAAASHTDWERRLQ